MSLRPVAMGDMRACSNVEECASCALHLWHVQRYAHRVLRHASAGRWEAADFSVAGLKEHWDAAQKFCFDFSVCPEVGVLLGRIVRGVRMRRPELIPDLGLDPEMTYCLAVQSRYIGDIRRDTVGSGGFV